MKIKVDMSQLISKFSLSKEKVNQLSQQAASSIVNILYYNWRSLASSMLHSTKNIYLKGLLNPKITSQGTTAIATIMLVGSLPNMIESGAPPWDMKSGFMRSEKVKTSKGGGWYLTIPFRFATPNSLGENESYSNKMSNDVFRIARKLIDSGSTSSTGNKKVYGAYRIRKEEVGEPTSSKGYGNYGVYEHKFNIATGMIKSGSKFMTFRRVSDKSNPKAFIHPGFLARNFVEKALHQMNIDTIASNVAGEFLEDLGW